MDLGELCSLLCALAWASAVVFLRKSGEHVAPLSLNLFKDLVALVLFAGTMLVLGVPFLPPGIATADWLTLLASGALGIGVADTIYLASLNRLGAGRAALVDCVYSPAVALVATLYLGEPLGPGLAVALALVVGAVLVSASAAERSGDSAHARALLRGAALGMLSMVLTAAGVVLAKPVLARTELFWAITVRLVGGVLVLVPVMLARRGAGFGAALRHWRTTVPAGIVGTYLSVALWIAGYKYTLATTAAVLNQTSTLFIFVLAAVFLHEPITRRKAAGIAMALAGAAVAVVR